MAYKGPQEVVGPASATDETLPRFDGTSGDLIQGSSIVVSDTDAMSGVAALQADSISFDTGTNTLEDFVDTTSWTPVLEFGGGTTGITYTVQQGKYTRIGSLVFLSLFITLSNKGSSTGQATITGLPYAANGNSAISGGDDVINTAAGYTTVMGVITNTSSSITVTSSGDNVASSGLTDANFNNTSTLLWSSTYLTSA